MPDVAEKRKQEVELVKTFIHSDLWIWLEGVLKSQQREFIGIASDPKWNSEQRALACGCLGIITKILEEPSRISRLAEHVSKTLEASKPKQAPQVQPD